MSQMNVSITPALARYVKSHVRSGRFNNASEVVREALRRMENQEQRDARIATPTVADVLTDFTAIESERIRRRVLESIAEIERGEYTEYRGKAGLSRLAAEIKSEGRQMLRKTGRQ